MRAAVCTSHMHSTPLETVVRMAREAGFLGLDINADRFERGPPPHIDPDADPDQLRGWQDLMQGIDGSASALSANIYLVSADPARAAYAKAHVLKVIQLAGTFNIPFVHVFTGRAPEGMPRPVALAQLADALAELCDAARVRGVKLGIEGCAAHFVCTTAQHLELFRLLPGTDLRVCFDPTHIFLHGGSTVEATDALGERISLVHVKDAIGRFPEFTLPPLGQGQMNWVDIFERLAASNYVGPLAVEYEAAAFGFRETDAAILTHARDFLESQGQWEGRSEVS